jgi:hypothetical protein
MARILFIIIFSVTLLLIAGCHRGAVIWGTWQQYSLRQVYSVGDSVTYDVTSYDTTGGAVFTFTVGGGYFSSYSQGTYILSGSTLYLSDTSHTPHTITPMHVAMLTHQSLVLQRIDTSSLSPLSVSQVTIGLAPQ